MQQICMVTSTLNESGWVEENALHNNNKETSSRSLMNVPTRQCLRKRERDKIGPSFQEHRVSVQEQRNGSIAETRNRGGISSAKRNRNEMEARRKSDFQPPTKRKRKKERKKKTKFKKKKKKGKRNVCRVSVSNAQHSFLDNCGKGLRIT